MQFAAGRPSLFLLCAGLLIAFATWCNSLLDHHPYGNLHLQLIPSTIGTYWLYRGESVQDDGPGLNRSQTESKVTVIDTVSLDNVTASLLECSHQTKSLSNNKTVRQPETFKYRIVFDNSRFYEGDLDRDTLQNSFWTALKKSMLTGKRPAEPEQSLMLLQLPAKVGSFWDNEAATARQDGFYSWQVESICPVAAGQRVAGYSMPRATECYSTAFRTCPDTTIYRFVPGIGITAHSYVHHGTIDESQESLQQFYLAP